ncbi:MAG TPA: hypothetical protein VMX97_18020, partial [Hyphomicrobiaceae bacterium]|nr:hypothetical protein [Hyphomicrobiaceae bacterium]
MAVKVPAGDLAKIQKAAPGEAPAKVIRLRRVLVFTLATRLTLTGPLCVLVLVLPVMMSACRMSAEG